MAYRSVKETRAINEQRIAEINKATNAAMYIDYAACYGGYCIESKQGSYRLTDRMSLKEISRLIYGMHLAVFTLPKL